MLNDWSDRLTRNEAAELIQRRVDEEVARRTAQIERELRDTFARQGNVPGFYDAMQHFLTLREKLFPGLPADPAWKILVVLARTAEGSDKASASGIAYGADVPLATALRYIAAMETQGIVERVANPADRRQVIIRLTPEGRRRLDSIAEKWALRVILFAVLPLTLLFFTTRSLAGL